jgi:hypothetical protein
MSGNSVSLCDDCETVECCMSNGCRVPIIQPCDIREVSYKEREDWKMRGALTQQVAGTHYRDMVIQPVEYVHANGLGYFEGNVIKYVSRWRKKGGLSDLEKAKHYIQLLIELESGHVGKAD